MKPLGVWVLIGVFSLSGAALDTILISNSSANSALSFFLSCISGEREASKMELQIWKDNNIFKVPNPPQFQFIRGRGKELRATGFSKPLDSQGIFYCKAKSSAEQTEVVLINNNPKAKFQPKILSVTANKGETVQLAVKVLQFQERDIMWKYNGNYHHMSHAGDIINDTIVLTMEGVKEENTGVYSAGYLAESPIFSVFLRLIVRVCEAKKWGPQCDQDCQECLNGGVCHDKDGDCICPPGFMGRHCETACRSGMFGRNCQESCQVEMDCSGLTFCLPDPYGCSCASGWNGPQCSTACDKQSYGPGCQLNCECRNGGTCNPFSGCQCPTGWRGQHCEQSDGVPQILDNPSNLEWNLNSSPRITCSASGNPLPGHGSIELRKLDGAVLKATSTTMESNKSTAMFEIKRLSKEHGGLWECRVSTNGGQDSRKFNLTVKTPPSPNTPPKLLERRSKQLVVLPAETFQGDGPIISTKLLYKPKDSGAPWSSIIVDNEPTTLVNLKPSTSYQVRVQLTRPGEGGEGSEGPEANLETDCPEPTVQPIIEFTAVESRNTLSVSWSIPLAHGNGNGFVVRLFSSSNTLLKEVEVPSLLIRTAKIPDLEFKQDYRVEVMMINCGSRGPPSEPYPVRITSQGPTSPRNVQATPQSISVVRLTWQPPVDPNGGIVKYIIEYKQVGTGSLHQWVDTDDGNKTSKDVTALNGSTHYQFRVRANSKVPGEWSAPVTAWTMGDGPPSFTPTTQEVQGLQGGNDQQLILAIVGSVSATCLTIVLALLTLFCIRRNLCHQRRTFTYQSGSGEETILQFNSGTLTLTRRPKPQSEPLTYPILEWDDIKFEDVIGEGNFGQVIKAMIKKDGNKISAAIKMLKEFASENDHRDFAGELEVLCKLGQHPNIINLIGACENRGYLYIAIEFAPFGNLLDFLRKSRVLETDPAFAKEHGTASTLTSQQLLQFAADVATGMQYLSEKQFIHRDLAARNVLVGENLTAKIADFGLSRGEEVYVKKTMGRLPVRWMAIESLNYSVYTTKSDVWSFGVLLWEIVSLGGTPYCGMTCAELYEKLPQSYRMEKPRNCDDEVYELMRQCWRDRPYERPTFAQISVQLNRMLEARKAYVNMALFENFTYAGIDATAEEA
ncbi:tyrosine-protein kinase receptor Tie-1-like isoform X1 [Polyodon spathula]|nr:tyrosine-protein kinase receptor Tie-1-like isoform X1 [Polyodon spathula]